MTSPRLTPIRSSRRRSDGIGSLTCAYIFETSVGRKIREQAVACSADDPSALCRYQRIDCAPEPTKSLVRTRLILAHQAAESDHIGMQYGGKFSLPRGNILRGLRWDIELGSQADVFNLAVDNWDYIR